MRDFITIVIPLVEAEWDTVGYLLRCDTTKINSIKRSNQSAPRRCCQELLIDWLETDHGDGIINNTWYALLNAIVVHKNFTKAIEDILKELEKKVVG